MPSISKTFRNPRGRALIGGILTLIILIPLSFTSLGRVLENFWLDRLYTWKTPEAPPADLLIVGIDEPSFQELGLAWPWPRRLHADLVDRLAAAGARLIVFDVVFAEPTTERDDALLQAAISQAGNVFLSTDLDTVEDRQFSRQILIQPYKPLRQSARALGLSMVTPDPDGVVRHFNLQICGQETLAAAVARIVRPTHPLPPGLFGLIDYAGPSRSLDTVSYYQVLDQVHPLPAGRIRDRIVLVGHMLGASPTPQVRTDTFYTPYYSTTGRITSGVEIHGQIVHTLLSGNWGRELQTTGRIILYGIVILVATYMMARLAPMPGLGFLGGLILLILGSSAALFLLWHYWAPPVLLVGGLAVLFSGNVLVHYLLEARERRWLRQAFGRYLSPSVVQVIVSHPERLQLGGEEVDGTVLFSDLAGFTAISENMAPADVVRLLNVYFSPLTEIILAHQGTLDKFIGDAIMAFWGAPLPLQDHAVKACQAALAMRRAMDSWDSRWQRQGLPKLRTRIGLHSGPLVAGNVGSRERFNYTVLGDTVNLASRLEGVNKAYGTEILISEEVHRRAVGRFLARELDLVRVKGRVEPVTIYELLAETPAAEPEWLNIFAIGRHAYREKDWDKAEKQFLEVLRLKPEDPPAQVFLSRVRAYRILPPPPQWDDVFTLEGK
ncbi:MAG: adenylate/guanylate cyclase domain-containing protein [Deltaproteobacteria bacterium]|nr:adenylate/guanylate cyclase domain-containing protein [Deltaproteobacteria bacterium]